MRNIFAACLALAIAPTMVMAGGGNSKEDPTLRVNNNGDTTALVVIDEFNQALKDAENAQAFQAAGGIVLDPGESSKKQDVKAGGHVVFFFFVTDPSDLPDEIEDFDQKSVTVDEDDDVTVVIPGDD